MKILSVLIMVIILLTGCNNNTSNNNEQINYKTNQSSTPTPQKIYGTFSTKITDKKPERLNNIKVGTEKLNGATIKAGEEFSFNSQIGPRNEETGFKKAIIFDGHGNKTDGYGGGVCQISSTLYNAALNAGLEITERHQHSRDVTYVEDGKDASVSYDVEDLKIKNNSNSNLKISASTDNDTLTITINQM